MITQITELNLIPNGSPIRIHVDQYDEGVGRLVFKLYEDDVEYSPVGATAVIQGCKPDGRGFDYNCTLVGNTVTADLTLQMTAVNGSVRSQIVVTEADGRIGSFAFIIEVQRSALPSNTDMSESEYQIIEQAILATQDAVLDAEAWAVGERGGDPVGPSDPTYHNNAEYWAYIASQYAQGGLIYKGSCLFANIPVSGMNHGDMWNIEDDFTTDSRFEEGAGIACAAGTNIAWNGSRWDVLAVAKSGVQSFNGRTGIVTPQAGDYDLTDLGDIVVTSATDGQVLKWDATSQKWVNGNASSTLAGLDDVSLSSPTNGQVLKYNSTSQEWENANESGGGADDLSDLNDVEITNPINSQVLSYDSTTQKWKNSTSQGGGLLPHFYIESESGSTVTVVAPDSTVITPTQVSSGHWECDVHSYGVYVVHSVLNSDDATVTVTVDDVKEYHITDNHYSYTLSVHAPAGSTIRVSASGETYTGTGAGATAVVFGLHQASTTYTVTNTIDGVSMTNSVTTPSTTGGSGVKTFIWGTINVTYENDFRGVSITCTLGATTITKTAPSAGNTMTFYPPTTGQWTISGTVGGTPYSKTANVTSLSTSVSVSLETVPDGKTATPTDDIETWLECGQITGKSYTTLSQVLADAETYERLLSDSNACDYMARSTTWAVAQGQVPTMTSDTTPSGVASSSDEATGNEAYKAFDGDTSTTAGFNALGSSLVGAYIRYEFPTAKSINTIYIRLSNGQSTSGTFKIQGSNDGSTFTDISAEFTVSTSADVFKEVTVSSISYTAYKYVQIICTAYTQGRWWLSNMQFYEADITTSQDAMMRLGKYDYACDALLADSTWAEAIANSDYFESVLDVKVPTMTSNTTPSGTAFASSSYGSGSEAYRAFDGVVALSNEWASASNDAVGAYIGYISTTPYKVAKLYFYNNTNGGGVNSIGKYKLQGSNDGFVSDIHDITEELTATTGANNVPILNDANYTGHRIYVTEAANPTSPNNMNVWEIQFYGRHEAQTDIIVTAHGGDTVYYMENGSPVPLTTADSDTGIGTVDWSDLPKGAITLYSSTAKNPSDLTADYSKTVYVTEYTTQIYLMPENALYWYGYKGSGLEVNGYTYSGTKVAPTFNSNNVTLANPASANRICIVNSLNTITGTAKLIGYYSTHEGCYFVSSSKSLSGATESKISTTNALYSASLTNQYIAVGVQTASGATANNMTLSALWYE